MSNNYNMNQSQVCLWCNSHIQPIDVHGHAQCPICKTNIDPCCSGEQECSEVETLTNQEQ